MTITASQVKELRDRTGAGMMDAKKALQENDGNMEAALDWLRTKGIAKAAKKSGRVASEGSVVAKSEGTTAAMVEVNSETDFAARNEAFQEFAQKVLDVVFTTGTTDIDALKNETYPGSDANIGDTLTNLVATIGENIQLRRAAQLTVDSGVASAYIHMGGKIGVLVGLSGDASDNLSQTAKQVAMHVAASNPAALDRDSLDADAVAREKAIFVEQAEQSGKPAQVIEKMVEGRMNKFFAENTLSEQAFIMDTDRKVIDVVTAAGGTAITGYSRFGLGEGIEKKEEDFAAEVAAAVNG